MKTNGEVVVRNNFLPSVTSPVSQDNALEQEQSTLADSADNNSSDSADAIKEISESDQSPGPASKRPRTDTVCNVSFSPTYFNHNMQSLQSE